MPVELAEDAILDALAVLDEWDCEAARDAWPVLESMGWEREGSLLLRRYDVQLLARYQLPRKWLVSPEQKRSLLPASRRCSIASEDVRRRTPTPAG